MTTEEFIDKIPFSKKARPVAYMDCGLIAIEKDFGVMAHPNPQMPLKEQSAILKARYNMDKEYFSWIDEESGEKMRLYLLNRLDSPTSGLLLAATNEEVAQSVKRAFKENTIEKIYYAVCINRPSMHEGIWSDDLIIKKSNNFVRAQNAQNRGSIITKKAITKFTFERRDSNGLRISLLKLQPITGRTHQLRIQCAKRKIPILGDQTYGDFAANRILKQRTGYSRLFLHCAFIDLHFDYEGKVVNFQAESPLPEEFDDVMEGSTSSLANDKTSSQL